MRAIANNLFRWYYNHRYKRIEQFMRHPHETQQLIFNELIESAAFTEWGQRFDYNTIQNRQTFADRIPVQDYESIKPYIQRMMEGEKDILWPGAVRMFSKSSGTTNDKSKFIPVSNESFRDCHIRGTWDTMTIMYHNNPDCKIFSGKNFLMAGNHSYYKPNSKTIYGDVSALMVRNMPKVARPFFEPDFDIVLRDDWESKIHLMVDVAISEEVAPMIRMVGGVPTWVIVFFRHILERSGKSNILEVWPNFEAYIHGGVNISPYREQLRQLLPSDDIIYMDVYNASEGYFGSQLDLHGDDMLLLLDNGVYYEFLPPEEWGKPHPKTVDLADVEVGKNYALLISTNAGLWRYQIGDTIMFTSTDPYRFKITGRVQQHINVFGEEVMVANTDKAIARACEAEGAIMREYSVAPVYLSGHGKGGHEWLVEFERPPQDVEAFADKLDRYLREINSDYDAKRYKDMALQRLRLRILPEGTFFNWLRSKGRYGNQSKVPRLSNNRKYVEEILKFTRSPHQQQA
ncbi:MAG: GH3 auxin-responsive promoter family protein [Bacteroidota bacterium]